MANPFGALAPPPQQDPQQAYHAGFMQDLAANLNQNYRPFTSGNQQRQQAQNSNYANQLEYNKTMYNRTRQQNALDLAAQEKETDLKRNSASYIDLFKTNKGKVGGTTMNQWLSMTDQDRSEIIQAQSGLGTGANPSATIQELRIMRRQRKILVDDNASKEEKDEAQFIMDTMYGLKRGAKLMKKGDITERYDYKTGMMVSTDPDNKSWAQEQEEVDRTAAERQRGIKMADKQAGYTVDFDVKLKKNIDTTEHQLVRLHKLRERVQDGPATGRMESLSAAWDAETQAMDSAFLKEGWNKVIDMKDQGMAFGNFTEKEFERIIKTLGTIGTTKEANLTILNRAIDDLQKVYTMYHDRYDNPAGFMGRKRERRTDFSSPRDSVDDDISKAMGGP